MAKATRLPRAPFRAGDRVRVRDAWIDSHPLTRACRGEVIEVVAVEPLRDAHGKVCWRVRTRGGTEWRAYARSDGLQDWGAAVLERVVPEVGYL